MENISGFTKKTFLMEDYTLIVSDRDKKVMGMLDPNGHPVFKGNEFTDEDSED